MHRRADVCLRGRWVLLLAVLLGTPALGAGDPAPGAVNAQTLKLPDGPGSVRGLADSPNVEVFSGQVSYSVPLDLPTGVGGFGPKLSLSYSGELGNGPVGVGWALPQASIRRSVRLGVPAYTSTDELELVGIGGGGRLVALPNGTWRVEGRGHAVKVERDGDGYVVTESGGVRYRLGVTAAGRQASGTRVASWHVEELIHPTGQSITFGYLQHGGQQYLSQVTWGPNAAFRAELVYGTRPDTTVSYRVGFKVDTAQRLNEVRVHSFGELLRVYVLGYEGSFPLSRLRTITMLGRDRVGALPTLTLSHAPAITTPTAVRVEPAAGWVLNTNGTSLVDVDGDGMADLLRLTSTGHSWRKGTGSGFGPARTLTGATGATLAASRFIDVDGDSRPELVRSFSEAWQINRFQGESLGTTATRWTGSDLLPLFHDTLFLADLNGDGRVDVVRSGSESLSVRWNRPAGLSAAVTRPAVDGVALLPGPNVRFHEVNGDGLADVVQLGTGWYKPFLGKGDGTFAATGPFNYPWGDSTNTANVRLGDLNRDGLMDLVHVLNGYVHWYAGRPGGGVEPTARRIAPPSPDGTSVVVALADINGNGSEEVVWSGPDGMWGLDLAGPTSAGMLVGLDNGMGKTVALAYQGSGQLSVAAETAGTVWTRKLPVAIPVPVRVEVQPGAGGPARVLEYSVRDGFWDGAERRFGGFLGSTVKTVGARPEDTLVETSRYHEGTGNERVLRGLVLEVSKRDGAGRTFSVSKSTYEARLVEGLPDTPLARKAARTEVRVAHHEGATTPVETLTTFSFDARVRPIEERHQGRVNVPGDEKTIHRVYAHDDTLWVQDVVCEEKLLEAGGTLVEQSRTFYGDATQVFSWTDPAQCRAGRLPRETKGWLADPTAPRWVLRNATEYDAWDNPTRVYTNGGWRTLAYDANHLHPVSESVVPAAGRVLTWLLDWDAVQGLPRKLTAPDGLYSEVTYDSLGRPAALAVNGASPHVRYAYDWTAPRPKTFTYSFDGAPTALEGSWTGGWVEGGHWREQVLVSNGMGESLFSATRLTPTRWAVSSWRERDARGEVAFWANPFYVDGELPTTRPTGVVGQSMLHDALGRLVTQTLPNGAVRTHAYKPLELTQTDSELAPVTSWLDGLERIIRTERLVGTTLESVDATYDAAGRIRAMRLQGGAVTHGFTYDTLGRLVAAHDPDIGHRTLKWDDRGWLTHHTNGANQTRQYFYDDAGRLTRTLGEDGTGYLYHYDLGADGTSTGNLGGRLAWVQEPRGEVHLAYDVFGRVARQRRAVDGLWSEEATVFSPSGLVLTSTVDGVSIPHQHDAAGRTVRVGTWWEAQELDASGRVMQETYGNGVRQVYQRDHLGLVSRVQTLRPTGTALYDVTLTRNAFGAPKSVTDDDGSGLNHSATFTYDTAARLTDAILGAVRQPDGTLGEGTGSFRFGYQYDGLQNMVHRQATGPRGLGMLSGTYHHAERGFGPRQLTRVATTTGETTLDYDAAGRVVREGNRTLEYNGLDQLVRVTLPGSGLQAAYVEHAYGYDGLRTLTRGPSGDTQYWFSPRLTQRDPNLRERYVKLGDRTLARITQSALTAMGPFSPGGELGGPDGATLDAALLPGFTGLLLGALGLVLLAVLFRSAPARARWHPFVAGLVAVCLLGTACEPGLRAARVSEQYRAAIEQASTLYFHTGVAAGPAVITRADGSVYEERRYEPFGAPIDAYREFPGGGSAVGEVDHAAEPLNTLNTLTDAHTGWSDHGARWMAPEMGRWLSPDPPVKAPDAKFLSAPWDLNPYAYVRQNPVIYWDPDGNSPVPTGTPGVQPYVPPPPPYPGGAPYVDPTPVVRPPMQLPAPNPVPPAIQPPPAPVVKPPLVAPPPPGVWARIGAGLLSAGRFLVSAPVVIITVVLYPSPLGDGTLRGGMHAAPQPGIKIPNSDLLRAPPERGRPPIGKDGWPVELHHRDQTMDGPIDELTRTDHRLGDNYKKNHPNTGQSPSKIDRDVFDEERGAHWEEAWDSGRFDDMLKAEGRPRITSGGSGGGGSTPAPK